MTLSAMCPTTMTKRPTPPSRMFLTMRRMTGTPAQS